MVLWIFMPIRQTTYRTKQSCCVWPVPLLVFEYKFHANIEWKHKSKQSPRHIVGYNVNSLEVQTGLSRWIRVMGCLVCFIVRFSKTSKLDVIQCSDCAGKEFLTNVRWMPATVGVGVNKWPICLHNGPLVWVKFSFNPGLLTNMMKVCSAVRWLQIFPSVLQVNSFRSQVCMLLWL